MATRRLAEPELVEGGNSQGVEQPAGRGERHPGPDAGPNARARSASAGAAGRSSRRAWSPRVRTDRPRRLPAEGSRARPPSTGTRRRRSASPHHVVEVVGPLGVHQHVAGLDRKHPEGGLGDHARSGPCRRPSPRRDRDPTSGVISSVPVGVTRVSDARGEQKRRRRWWFLPWMSAAMAPPTVTWRVPGVTGTNQPSGTRGP